jgi:hypothetical protein
LREVCEETFQIREKHPWPPTILVHPHWGEPFAVLAQGEVVSVPDAHQAAEDVREYVRAIAES